MRFRHYRQYDISDCGPVCLKMIDRHHGQKHFYNIVLFNLLNFAYFKNKKCNVLINVLLFVLFLHKNKTI